ncbi:M4 family metallopeptidase [Hymenobacter weizhouensis]|uniref:M4 family metallopeptidase n=1 Tax=Hymenobacter sp. YIM 151500-1 TaxID=2987689 RepID=UPI0022269596|nr:M4 family metallopeptidase [Hymenobacter sp. YIM 151500-1]UYZ62924.1 M4 family metallopeptidase [Hymenobacter sp. YIM 151500-1]
MHHKYTPTLAGLLLCGLLGPGAQAQQQPSKTLAEDGSPVLVQLKGGNAYGLGNAQQALTEQLGLKSDDYMRRATAEIDELGFVHEKYSQFYKGIKVEHADYTVHAHQGKVESLSGHFKRITNLSVVPTLTEQVALQRALAFVGAQKYMWQDPAEEAGLKQQENNPAATYKPQGELVIVGDRRGGEGSANFDRPVLAWKFNVYAQQPMSRAYIYVDARSGEIVLQDAIIKHAAATGSFATRYSSTQSASTDSYNSSYRLRDYTRGNGVEIYNARKSNSLTGSVDFTDADNNWTEYNNTNVDNVALDAMWGAQATYDYWKTKHNRNSYNNAGAVIKGYVHFDDTPGDGKGMDNAYWNGSVMLFGDGYQQFKPMGALDVTAHEIGHAVCSSTAALVYQAESGALNEGFSDIWGACVESFKTTTKQTWLVGEEIVTQGVAARSMSNPKSLGQPAYYKGQYWFTNTGVYTQATDYGGVHINSGVMNHWFYILSVGKSGTNEGGYSYSVTGIGMDKAAKIAFRTESVYLTSTSTFANARTYSIQAATDLYGAGSAEVIATTNAWYAVGVGGAYGGATAAPVAYCASNGNDNNSGWIDLVNIGAINRSSGKDAGGYYNGTASSTSVAPGSSQTLYFSAGFATTGTAYWKIFVDWNQDKDFADAGELLGGGSNTSASTLNFTFTVPTTAKTGNTRLRVSMSSADQPSCGSFAYGEVEDYTLSVSSTTSTAFAGLGSGSSSNAATDQLEVYPNPVKDVLHLVLPANAAVTSVEVLDVHGRRVADLPYRADGQLNVSNLAKGMYTVAVSDGQRVFHQRFVKD